MYECPSNFTHVIGDMRYVDIDIFIRISTVQVKREEFINHTRKFHVITS